VLEGRPFAYGRFDPSSVLVLTKNAAEESPKTRKTSANRTKHAHHAVSNGRRPTLPKALWSSETVFVVIFPFLSIEKSISFRTGTFSRRHDSKLSKKNSINLTFVRSVGMLVSPTASTSFTLEINFSAFLIRFLSIEKVQDHKLSSFFVRISVISTRFVVIRKLDHPPRTLILVDAPRPTSFSFFRF